VAIVTSHTGKELNKDQGSITGENVTNYRAELQGCRGALYLLNEFSTVIKQFCYENIMHRIF
jgi:hypothetical protein